MKKLSINRHIIKMYDSVDEIPMNRFVEYNRCLLIDSEIGGDAEAISTHIEKMRAQIKHGRIADLNAQLENYQQALLLSIAEINIKCRAFAALVHSVDGKPFTKFTDDDAIRNLQRKLTVGVVQRFLDEVKKNLDHEFSIYFPDKKPPAKVNEFYAQFKKKILLQLDGILGADVEEDLMAVENSLLALSPPAKFYGPDGAEVALVRNFQDSFILLGQHTQREPHQMSVLEFYRTLELLEKQQQ